MSSPTQLPAAGALVAQERAEGVAILRLNRPERLNALNVELAQSLLQSLLLAAEDKSARAVIITGAGRGFCVGGDLHMLRDLRRRNSTHEFEALLHAGKEICLVIATMPKPVIAAVNGPAAGGGMNLALAADMRIASEKAVFAESFSNIGLYPDFGGTYFLPRIVGPVLAAGLFYTAEILSAEQALRLGIVNRVFPVDTFHAEAVSFAQKLASGPPLALRDVKRTI